MAKKASNRGSENRQSTPAPATEEIQRRIAEAVYFRALQRGFQGCDPLEDWLQAEQEIVGESTGSQLQT